MNVNWKKDIHDKFRVKFGCKNIGEVCWCKICVNIETLIDDTISEIKKNIN